LDGSVAMEKIKYKINKLQDDVLEETSVARYQMLPRKSKLLYQKELGKFTDEWKTVSEKQ
jgi:hypothetical protein